MQMYIDIHIYAYIQCVCILLDLWHVCALKTALVLRRERLIVDVVIFTFVIIYIFQ